MIIVDLKLAFNPTKVQSMDRFQILKPVPRHRIPRDGLRLLDSSTLEKVKTPNLSQEVLENYLDGGK